MHAYARLWAFSIMILILTGAACLSWLLRPYLPSQPLNALAQSKGEFLERARRDKVPWQVPSKEAFDKAKRLDQPILILIGSAWSPAGRALDQRVFSDPDIVGLLNREYLCFRVDADQNPEWATHFLPLARGGIPWDSSIQAHILAPTGALLDTQPIRNEVEPIHADEWEDTLRKALRLYARTKRMRTTSTEWQQIHQFEVEALQRPIQKSTRALSEVQKSKVARIRIELAKGIVSPAADARLLHTLGEKELVTRWVTNLISSKKIDWLDGGFFAGDGTSVRFDKLGIENAELMALLAKLGKEQQNQVLLRLSEQTRDWLASCFYQKKGLATFRTSDEDTLGRSKRSSFSPGWLAQNLSAEERHWLTANMNMKPRPNRAMFLQWNGDKNIFDSSSPFQALHKKLLDHKQNLPQRLGGYNLPHSMGYIAARCFESAKILNDTSFSELGERILKLLEADLPKTRNGNYLGDALAYSEASLENYQLTKQTPILQKGFEELKKARARFRDPKTGLWLSGSVQALPSLFNDQRTAEILDGARPPSQVTAIKLCWAYGNYFPQSNLKQEALKMIPRLDPLVDTLQLNTSSYMWVTLPLPHNN